MAKTQGERLEYLEQKLVELEKSLAVDRVTSNLQNEQVRDAVKELQTVVKELQAAEVQRAAAEAKLDQRCTALEKNADRGWQLWLAALGFGFGLISLLVTAALQLKK